VIYSKKYKLYIDGDYDKFWPTNPTVSAEFKDLFMRMIVKNPEDRITLKEVIDHPWTQIQEVPTD
jgi:serine/threonine protein kinase